MVAAHKNRVRVQGRVRVKFPGFLEELSQVLPVVEVQPNPAVFEPELLGKTSGRVGDLSVFKGVSKVNAILSCAAISA